MAGVPEGEPSDNLYICGLPDAFDTDCVRQFFGAIGTVTEAKSFGHGFALVRFSNVQEATMVKTSLNGQQPVGCAKPLTITFAAQEKKDAGGWGGAAGGAPADQMAMMQQMMAMMGGGKGGKDGPYGKGGGKGKDKGPMCTVAEFIAELINGGLPGGDRTGDMNCVCVKGLPPDCQPENMYQIFSPFGALPPKAARVETDGPDGTGNCTGTGYVSFLEPMSADMAVMALHGIELMDGTKMECTKVEGTAPAEAAPALEMSPTPIAPMSVAPPMM
jgi:hypothetical protein